MYILHWITFCWSKRFCLFSPWTKLELNFAKGLVVPARFFKLAPTFSASKESMLAILSVPMDTNNYPCVNNKVTMLTRRWVVRVIAITSVNPQTQHRYDHLISGTSHISLHKSVIITTTVLLLGFFLEYRNGLSSPGSDKIFVLGAGNRFTEIFIFPCFLQRPPRIKWTLD